MATATQNKASKTRQLTICHKAFQRAYNGYATFPIIKLTGKWLKDSGFKGGQVIDVVCYDGRLVITIAKEQRFEHV